MDMFALSVCVCHTDGQRFTPCRAGIIGKPVEEDPGWCDRPISAHLHHTSVRVECS